MLKLDNVKVFKNVSKEEVLNLALKKYRVSFDDVLSYKILKKSIDARDKKNIHYLYSLAVEVRDEKRYPKIKKHEVIKEEVIKRNRKSEYDPIIVGAGPSGLFCALTLIENGYRPIIIEQGNRVEERINDVRQYRENSKLNTRSNVQFGEGGAGTFSDGKLSTGINSIYINKVLETFHKFGAPEEITYLAHPHIGTDNLVNILINIRKYIEENGGKYYFNTKLTDFEVKKDYLKVICEDKNFETDALVLAIGHSARDTFEMLLRNNVEMKKKNFSVGVRIEHLQKDIDLAQYGDYTDLDLPAAEYKLVYHNGERVCYSFCMCPGGEVMASSSELNSIVTNGMSNYKRDGRNANAGILVNVLPEDVKGDSVLAGIDYQKELERKAFELGGSNYHAPVQRFEDFVNNCKSERIGKVEPTYKPGYTLSNLNEILPEYVAETLKEGIRHFDKKIKGFADPDSILTAVETRTSSPVTVIRNDDFVSNIEYIYPCGEGCGYAGGITSAAVDGIKTAIKIIEKD